MKIKKALVVGVFALTLLASFFGGVAYSRQPYMQLALNHLEQAKAQLQQANNNKGGHRANAIDLVSRAIKEVRLGIDYANDHP